MAIRLGESVTVKAVIIGVIVLVLLVPLMMLRSLVTERSVAREQAYAKVAQGWGGALTVGGPMLVVPTERLVTEERITRVVREEIYVLPESLEATIELKLEPQPRYVGIYAVPVYIATVHLSGHFDSAALRSLLGQPDTTYLWAQGRLRLPMSQVRSLREVRLARLATRDLEFGPASPGTLAGVESLVDLSGFETQPLTFEFETAVAGSRELSVLPLGSTTSVRLSSDWPHPAFDGAFLPVERSITAQGFQARWQVLELNRAYRQVWRQGEIDEATLQQSALGVGIYQAVDVYQRGERAIKYALLFIALTFMSFFAWEQLARIRLHPLQYLLVGLALSTFYLLLIALSEHMAFAAAYGVAAASLVLLLGIYVAGALRSRARGAAVAAGMTAVYGVLYVLVLSEDYALLLGAIVLYAALATVMLVTRRIDWYQRGERPAASAHGEAGDP